MEYVECYWILKFISCFQAFEDALIDMLKEVFGKDCTPDTVRAWRKLFKFVTHHLEAPGNELVADS